MFFNSAVLQVFRQLRIIIPTVVFPATLRYSLKGTSLAELPLHLMNLPLSTGVYILSYTHLEYKPLRGRKRGLSKICSKDYLTSIIFCGSHFQYFLLLPSSISLAWCLIKDINHGQPMFILLQIAFYSKFWS